MRFSKFVLVLGLATMALLTWGLMGCSDDGTTSTGTTYGSLTDPEFVAVQTQVAYLIDSNRTFWEDGITTLQGIVDQDDNINPILYAVGLGQNDPQHVYVNGWHVIELELNTPTYTFSLLDSVQYLKNGVPDSSAADADAVSFKHQWTFSVIDTTATYGTLSGNVAYTFSDLDGLTATITGSNNFAARHKYVSNDSTVWRDYTTQATLTNVTLSRVPWLGTFSTCPCSGQFAGTLQETYRKDAGSPSQTTWTATASFTDGSMTATIGDGTTTWRYTTDLCTPPQ